MQDEKIEDNLFRYTMWWRIFYGVLRTVLGLALLKVTHTPFSDLLYTIMGKELIEDPSDFLFNTLLSFLQVHPLSVTYFLSAYLIFWGLLDIFLSINLLKHRVWAFPVSLYLIAFFMIYEMYRFFHTYSLFLFSVIVIDVAIFMLIRREYKKRLFFRKNVTL